MNYDRGDVVIVPFPFVTNSGRGIAEGTTCFDYF
jgi:hypothetical protein